MSEQSPQGSRVYLELRRLHSPDAEDLRSPGLEDSENFCLLVQALVGPRGERGEEGFSLLVCTPRWLADYLRDNKPLFARHYLFVDHYNYDAIRDRIDELCRTTSGHNWTEAAERLARYGYWEFEDYHPHEGS